MSNMRGTPVARSLASAIAAIIVTLSTATPPAAEDTRAPQPSTRQDPRLPAGVGQNGVPIAIIGPGVDYRDAKIGECLARDGEGVLVGWDFVDSDIRPFRARRADELATFAKRVCGQAEGATNVSAIVFRTDGTNIAHLGEAIGFAVQTPARIVVYDHTAPNADTVRYLSIAARAVTDRVFIVSKPISSGKNATAVTPMPRNLIVIETNRADAGDTTARRAKVTMQFAAALKDNPKLPMADWLAAFADATQSSAGRAPAGAKEPSK
ncbi:MAG: hypothetical protein AAFY64_00135 [Pseudomonadota bacterium]